MSQQFSHRLLLLLAGSAMSLPACTGTIAGSGPSATQPDSPPVDTRGPGKANPPGRTGPGNTADAGQTATPAEAAKPGAVIPGPMPLRRLTRLEYLNTLQELFHFPAGAMPAIDLPTDARANHGFTLASPVGEVDVSRLQDAADLVAGAVTAAKNLSTLLPCDPAKGDARTCARTFIERFGRRAFRRPLTATETTDLLALFDDATTKQGFDFAGATAQLIRGILQSPQFIYRWELGPTPAKQSGQVIALNGDELASRLSYFLWSSMPDDALFAAVDGGKLLSGADVTREARRMLADPRSRATLDTFHKQWLRLRMDLPNDLARSMDTETNKFVENVFENGDGHLETLLLSPVTFVNKSLATIYGVTGVTGVDLTQQTLDGKQRFGLLTQPNFLTITADGAQSHPVRRGSILYQQLLCGTLPPQPANVPSPDPPRAGLSNRERFAVHAENACAKGCHGLMDPLGFAFENYDGLGQYRTQDGGKPVDATGSVDVDGKSQSFTNARDLMGILATSPTVRDCMANQWIRFALARAELPTETAALAPAHEAFAHAQFDLRELIVAVAQMPSFLNRTPAAMEVLAP